MNYLFFDIEATSKFPTNAQVLEFAYIVVNEEFRPLEMKDMFFAVDREVPQSSVEVHGLTRQKLMFLSEGHEFYESAEEIRNLFYREGLCSVGYNSLTYDIKALNNNFVNAGVLPLENIKHIDVYSHIRNQPLNLPNKKLGTMYSYALHTMGISKQGASELFTRWCDTFGYTANCNLHGALYDSFVTAFTMFALRAGGMKFE